MNRTYKAIGINLKSIPFGEADRLVTILTREFGLIQAVAPGVRKPKSKLGGRSGLFVVNELLLNKGRSLDRITQANTLESHAGLSRDLGKLAAAQYLAELVICQALREQPQDELFILLGEHLKRIEGWKAIGDRPSGSGILPLLTHGIYHLLAVGGIAPQVHACCITKQPLQPDFTSQTWRVGFSVSAGGTVSLPHSDRLTPAAKGKNLPQIEARQLAIDRQLNAVELEILQQLSAPELPQQGTSSHFPSQLRDQRPSLDKVWISVERLLRHYAQYHYGRSIRSAQLIETYMNASAMSPYETRTPTL
ncbi:DNA repair protein RecO [Phormidium sp. CCY1219]|uniref:DNA repair protein RecO n=1 Tax=Phormidium sp. CCY1219 TaxID=2886104 RepID=UPI002D1F5869|nr:DNA repair protein RecO [Phormidium sp. CCY1219]MEB3830415.1 DNA repair protein RecO [Phormidium sp. CCY1219]